MLDAAEGAVYCNKCLRERNGDGLAALQWLLGWTLPEALNAVAAYIGAGAAQTSTHERKPEARPAFDCEAAWAVYERAVARVAEVRDLEEHPTVEYLTGRGLRAALDRDPMHAVCGILDSTKGLHEAVRYWPSSGYRLVAGLWSVETGDLVAVQGRDVGGKAKIKVMTPRGAAIAGTVFASPSGRDLLRGESDAKVVVYGEGLTDSLVLSLATELPVLTVPGVGQAPKCVGAWAHGRTVVIALDTDDAGEAQVKPTTEAIVSHGGRAVRLTWPSGNKDACDVLAKYGLDGMRARLDAFVRKAVSA